MARMHSRARGKSGSKKPIKKAVPAWVVYKPKEVEMLITKYAKEGKKPSQIGMIMRDQYGIPDVKILMGKSITHILKEKHLQPDMPEDLLSLLKKSIMLKKHLEANKKDESCKRGLTLTDSKVKRLVKYYKNSGRLPKNWSYDPDKVKIMTE